MQTIFKMVLILGLLLVSLAVSLWLFWSDRPKKIFARKVLIFARVFTIVVWLVVLSGMVYFTFFFSLLGEAEDEMLFQQKSPDNFYTVAAFNRFGGATVNNTTVVSIRLNSEKLDTKNNLIVFSENGIRKVNVNWDGNKHLTIRYDAGEVYAQVTNWNDVSITYIKE